MTKGADFLETVLLAIEANEITVGELFEKEEDF